MPAVSLRCRVCESECACDAVGVCARCFGPLDPIYDWDVLATEATRERFAAGPASIWRYAPLLPVAAPAEPRLAPGLTLLVPAPRLAEAVGVGELYLKLDTANPTHSFKDRVVAVACAKAQELGLDVLACSSTGNLANAVAARAAAEGLEAAVFCPADLEPEKLVATAVYGATIYAVRGTYDDCSRLTVELSFELPWAFVNVGLRAYYAEGSKTLAYEISEQLGWRRDGQKRRVAPDRGGTGGEAFPGRLGREGVPVVDRIEGPKAASADAHGVTGVLALTDSATKGDCGHCLLLPLARHILPSLLLGRAWHLAS